MADEAAVLLSSTVFSFAMNSMVPTAALLAPYTTDDGNLLVTTLNFLYLTILFSPAVVSLSRGAMGSTNSSAVLISWLTGKNSTRKFLSDTFLCIAGAYFGVLLWSLILQQYPIEGVSIRALEAAAGSRLGFAFEAFSTVIIFGLDRAVSGITGRHTYVLGALVYVAISHFEGCNYSCNVINPAAALALQIHEFGLRSLLSAETWGKLLPYVFGGWTGATLLSIIHMRFPPPVPKTSALDEIKKEL
uniref:Aquaporin n=1 Tax=Pyramimonas obovata TaxID=1411642 RepID=A0A7S0WH97_9CHLO|mmetsp:Transcript_25701/g.55826  ORF Transcript_25701/g.55826 Transcript_25701/m.55826 type:complete len:246 (+) Transcript_25701:201-938(+)|eukprot:CAMPEP_0118945556 /NCGR_PEP_ID=MMETSP1169-20130426/42510_1 /TAXON_ID=36882 /ORGANISM="Pyramimonas obovata, Strain CCMP722" /LENGTH=245 /DNA_ID=CAMNT_0006891303 /DNA_START=129 /DNA_END=866 /DNA_ORIENTATION=+